MSHQKGFTLLELLAVVLIIGIVISFATLAIGDKKQQLLRQELKQLSALIQLTQQEAIFKNQILAIRFTEKSYQFYNLLQTDWQRLKKAPFRSRLITAGLQLELQVEDNNMSLLPTASTPQLLLLPSGEITPFKLFMWHEADEYTRWVLAGNLLGELDLSLEGE